MLVLADQPVSWSPISCETSDCMSRDLHRAGLLRKPFADLAHHAKHCRWQRSQACRQARSERCWHGTAQRCGMVWRGNLQYDELVRD